MIHRAPEFLPPLTPVNTPIHRCPVSREQASHRIVIMRLGAHGDILMGTPLLAALREAYPTAHLSWIVEHREAQSIDGNPYIDEYISWDGAYWKKPLRRGNLIGWGIRLMRAYRALRAKRYDVFISFQPEEWPLLTRGIGAPVSIGVFDTFRMFNRDQRVSRNVGLYTDPFAHPHLPDHRIDQYLLPLKALGLPGPVLKKMTMGYTEDDSLVVDRFLRERGVAEGSRFTVIAPFTTWPTRCWPSERYVDFADQIVDGHPMPIVLIGSAKERAGVEDLARRLSQPPIVAAGVLTFRQMAALIQKSSLLVSGDTGPMHVAAAVDTPHLSLFGPTAAEWRAPLQSRGITLSHPIPCGPCDQKICPNKGEDVMLCMRLIRVEEAIAAARNLLAHPVENGPLSV